MALRRFETLTIGDTRVHRLAQVAYFVKYKSKRKIDEKESDGSSDATTTDKGRAPRDVTIHLSWPDIPELNKVMGPILKNWDPGGPDGGKPFDYAHERNGLDMGDIKAVRSIVFKDADGPNVEPGSGTCVVEYSCDSWSKPSAKADAGKTPEDGDKKKFDTVDNTGQPIQGGAPVQPKPPDVQP